MTTVLTNLAPSDLRPGDVIGPFLYRNLDDHGYLLKTETGSSHYFAADTVVKLIDAYGVEREATFKDEVVTSCIVKSNKDGVLHADTLHANRQLGIWLTKNLMEGDVVNITRLVAQ